MYDSVNIFPLVNPKHLPEFETIVLNFGFQKSNFKRIVTGLLALKFVTSKNSKVTISKHLNIFLKIKQGVPVGCKIVLRKKIMHQFYSKLTTSIFPKLKKGIVLKPPYKSLSITINNPLLFLELENSYETFKDIPKLDITFITNSKSKKEYSFLLKSIKIFL